MTDGHQHRTIHLNEQGALLHLLRTPLARTADPERAESSRWIWGMTGRERIAGDGIYRLVEVYTLTPLSILHTLFGFTIDTREKAR